MEKKSNLFNCFKNRLYKIYNKSISEKSLISLFLIFFIFLTGFSHKDLDELSRAYILMDYDTGEILENYKGEEVVEIASITKLMTYLIARETMDAGKISPKEKLVAEKCDIRSGATLNIQPGNSYSIEQLLEAMIVISGNDATALLARRISGSEAEFVKLMNKKAMEMGLNSASFYNSTGLPIYPENIQNTMSARDVAKMASYVINKYPDILDIAQIPSVAVEGKDEPVMNTNPLLGIIDSVDGLKTGSTLKAGYCLVWTSKKDNRLIGVNLGFKKVEDRNEKVRDYARYATSNYLSVDILEVKNAPYNIYMPTAKDPLVNIVAEVPYYMYNKDVEGLKKNIIIYQNLEPPLRQGERVGEIFVIDSQGNEIFKTYLNTTKPVKEREEF